MDGELGDRRRTGSNVSTLAVLGRRIVSAVEELCAVMSNGGPTRYNGVRTNELVVLDDAGVKLDPHRLCVVGRTGTDLAVGWVRDILLPASVPHRRLEDTLVLCDGVVLQEDVLDAPEAARGEGGNFRLGSGHGGDGRGLVLELDGREGKRE